MPWYERITEAAWFKRAYQPEKPLGSVIAKATGAVLLIGTVGVGGYIAAQHDAGDPGLCDSKPLRGVYRPFRLRVIDTCVTETVTVVEARKERDGDLHVAAIPEHADLINAINKQRQHGYLLVEFVPGDPRPKTFRTGMRLKITGTLVEDLQHGPAAPGCLQMNWPCDGKGDGPTKHGYRELHPIFAVEEIVDPGLAPAPKAPPIPGEEQNDPD